MSPVQPPDGVNATGTSSTFIPSALQAASVAFDPGGRKVQRSPP